VGFMPRPFYPQYVLNKRLVGTQKQSGRCGEVKLLDTAGTRSRPVRSQFLYRLC
jgi:hypothetical protein